MKEMRGLVRHW